MPHLIEKVNALSFDLRQIADLAGQTPGCLRADLGELKYPLPVFVKDTIIELTEASQWGYAPTFGEPVLLEALRAYESTLHALYEESKILITAGGQAALFASLSALLRPGDRILTGNFFYPPYSNLAKLTESELVCHSIDELDTLDPGGIRVVILNSPNNPTGQIYSPSSLQSLSALARKHDWIILEDAVYNQIYFDQAPQSITQFCPERTLVINSASKNFCMPGIRIGWLTGPTDLVTGIAKLHRNMNSCPNAFFQKVLARFLPRSSSFFEGLREEMRVRRDLMLRIFDELGWEYDIPGGAIYAMARVPGLTDPLGLVEQMIRQAGVSAMPGTFFGAHPDRLRFCYGALSLSEMAELRTRIKSIY